MKASRSRIAINGLETDKMKNIHRETVHFDMNTQRTHSKFCFTFTLIQTVFRMPDCASAWQQVFRLATGTVRFNGVLSHSCNEFLLEVFTRTKLEI